MRRIPTIAEYEALAILTRTYLAEFATAEFSRTSLSMLQDFREHLMQGLLQMRIEIQPVRKG